MRKSAMSNPPVAPPSASGEPQFAVGAGAALTSLMRSLDPFAAACDSYVGGQYLNEISSRLSLPRRFVSLGIVGFGLCFVLFGLGQGLLCTVVGVVYPAYMSMKALEAKPLSAECMVQWLTYWVCYSVFSVIEIFVKILLFWVPFYYIIKLIFLVYLMHPYTRGAFHIYNRYLQSPFAQYSTFIDRQLARLDRGTASVTAAAGRAAGVIASASGGLEREDNRSPGSGAETVDPRNIFGPQHSE